MPASAVKNLLLLSIFSFVPIIWVQAFDDEPGPEIIRFQIVPEQESFECERGVWLNAIVTNISTMPVAVVWGDYPYDDLLKFELARPDGGVTPPPRQRLCPPVDALTSRDVITLLPGESRERMIVLSMMPGGNVQTFRFVYPGEYLLRTRLRVIPVESTPDSRASYRQSGEETWVQADELKLKVLGTVPDPTLHFSMRGVVEDTEGDPIPDAEIHVESQHEGFGVDGVYWHRIDRVVTDGRGRFGIEGLDRSVARYRLIITHPDHPNRFVEIPTTSNEGIVELDPLQMRDGFLLPGIVTDVDGNPIVGARVSTSFDRTYWTNLEGKFEASGFVTSIEELAEAPQFQIWKRGWVDAEEPELIEIEGRPIVRYTLMPESEQQITGIARFENGELATNCDLYVYRSPSDGYPIESTIDVTGRFAIDWPQVAGRSNHGVVVVLSPGEHHLPRRAWIAPFDEIAPGESNVEFTFPDSKSLAVTVTPTNTLPESATMTVNVRLATAGNREQWLFEEHLPSTGGSLSWDRLSPGDYKIEVTIDHANHWNWNETVTIASDADVPATCDFDLPELLFGDATIQVVTSDGVTPWRGGNLWIDSSHGWGSIPVRNGRASLRDIPAGRIQVSVHTDGYARTRLHGEIIAGETVELGILRALTIDEGSGLVVGRVLLMDGGPAIGARVQAIGGSYGRAPHLGGEPVDGDGLFEIRLDPGKQTLQVELSHIAAIDSTNGGFNQGFFSFSQRQLAMQVDVEAGEESQIEIVIPPMTSELQIGGESLGTALLYVPLDASMTFEDTKSWNSMMDAGITFTQLPEGLAQLILSRPLSEDEFTDRHQPHVHVWEHRWVDIEGKASTLEVEEVQAARVQVSLTSADGEPITNFLLRATPQYDDLPEHIRAMRTPTEVRSTGVYVEDGNGVLYLAPGRYDVSISEGGRTITRSVEIHHQETVTLEVEREAD